MSIEIQQPQPYDIVSDSIHIAGMAGGAFEGTYIYLITDGHDEVTDHFTISGGIPPGQYQFQLTADISGASFVRTVAYLELFHTPPTDGGPERVDRVVVPILLGSNLIPDYNAYIRHEVSSGETLWGIAQEHYRDGNLYHRLLAANPAITNPNLIRPGDIIRVPHSSDWP